jgi:hypothetical protein
MELPSSSYAKIKIRVQGFFGVVKQRLIDFRGWWQAAERLASLFQRQMALEFERHFHTPPKLRKVAALSANVVFDAMGYPNIALLKGNDSHALLVRVSHVDILQMITFAPYAM